MRFSYFFANLYHEHVIILPLTHALVYEPGRSSVGHTAFSTIRPGDLDDTAAPGVYAKEEKKW